MSAGGVGGRGYQQISTNKPPGPYSYLQTGFQRTRLNMPQAAVDGQGDSGRFSGSSKKFFVRRKYQTLPTANLGTLQALWEGLLWR